MSHCVRGALVFWLLVMTFIGANLGTAYAGKNLERNNGRRAEITDRGSSLDSPTDVLWRDRLLIEDTQPSPSDTNSGLLVRRITPKSVFVAPSFSGCSEGYRQDIMGRCVKLVKVNQAAQLDFILQKLNSMYAPSHNSNKNNNKNENENSGPFHVSLPLGTLDNYSISSNNNNTPNDKEKQKITSTENKHSVEEISSDNIKNNRNNSSSISNSETNTKKTELLHIINLPSTTTESSQITVIKPQHNNNNNSNTVVNNYEETTTSIFTTDAIVLPTTLLTPVESPEDNQYTLIQNNFDSTVKREPQNHNNNNENKDLNTKKPFVIVVANSTYHPFESTVEEHLNTNTEETIPVIDYDYNTTTTTDTMNKGIQMTTEDIIQDTTSLSTIFNNNNNSDIMETITINDGFTTILSTTMKTTLSNEQPSTFTMTTETTPFDSTVEDSSLHINTHTTTTMIPNTSIEEQENEEIDEDTDSEGDEESDIDVNTGDTSSIFGAVIHVNSNNNKNIRESSRIPPLKMSEIPSIPVNLPDNTRPKCNYPLRITGSNYGNSNINCEPEITTVRYPIRTTTPKQSQNSYFIRFPVDNINSSPPSSSSSSVLTNNGYKNTNSYVRFPEQSLSIYGSSSSYGTKLWNSEPVAASSTMWYPQSWFPYMQPHRTWSHDDNDNNNNNNHRNQPSHNQPMSNVYHKQYHQHHLLPQNVPTWINTHSTWPQRD